MRIEIQIAAEKRCVQMGKTRITLRDIARETGVGLGTVTRALNGTGSVSDEKRRIICECAEQMGYVQRPYGKEKNQKQMVKKHGIVGVIIPDLSFPFYGTFLRYVEFELARCAYHTMVFNAIGGENKISDILELLEDGVLDGLIINADIAPNEVEKLKAYPVVSFERMLGRDIPLIASEHRKGGRMAARLLLAKRCSKVLIITARHQTPVYADIRIKECQERLQERGVAVIKAEFDGEMASFRQMEDVVEQYLEVHRDVDGVFADDLCAYYSLMYARRHEIHVPNNLKIIGYDGNEITQLVSPRITTIAQDFSALSKTAADLIVRRIRGEAVERKTLIPVRLEDGGTI